MDRLVTLGLLESLKNSDDILEGKMVELNKKKSKQPDGADAVQKCHFTLKISE